MMQSLPGILKIGITPIASLPVDVIPTALAGMVVQLTSEPEVICTVGASRCQFDENFDNNGFYQGVELKFSTVAQLQRARWAFVVWTVNGELFLIGADTPPNPIMEYSKDTGEPSGEASVYEYKVKWLSKKALIPCKLPTNQGNS